MPFIVSAPGNPKLLDKLGVKCGDVRDDLILLERWGDRCVNPEYDIVKNRQ